MGFIKERIGKFLEYLKEQIYTKTEEIPYWYGKNEDYRYSEEERNNLPLDQFFTLKREEIFGGHRAYFSFYTTWTVPESFSGKTVVFSLETGKEGLGRIESPILPLCEWGFKTGLGCKS